MLCPVKHFSSEESEMHFFLSIVNDIPKAVLNLQWPLPVKVMKLCHLCEKLKY